jgi:hypothetical protein
MCKNRWNGINISDIEEHMGILLIWEEHTGILLIWEDARPE